MQNIGVSFELFITVYSKNNIAPKKVFKIYKMVVMLDLVFSIYFSFY